MAFVRTQDEELGVQYRCAVCYALHLEKDNKRLEKMFADACKEVLAAKNTIRALESAVDTERIDS